MVVLFTMATIPAMAHDRNRNRDRHHRHNNNETAIIGLFLGLIGGAMIVNRNNHDHYRPRQCETFYIQEWDPYIPGYRPVPYTRCN